ncbi:uncharacterized protein LOC105212541 isoform X2 [Zeugodacus cucurbitae]|nr:uncharacterized protein LOC105212541 isoform X2 [Zeugodacus cucurbitae]XP_011182869.1 uncharacterized protein LOC105212541 isoform X2 [Zeugodacus cucurbitae]
MTSASNFEAKISLDTPLADYERLIEQHVQSENVEDDATLENNYNKIATAARATVDKLLFESGSVTKENQEKIAEFLSKVKEDACFYNPNSYNEWIVGVRDKVLKNNMLDFWCDHMVKKELGICWARDSDYYDDMEDPEPRAFYNHAGCVAPFDQVDNSSLSNFLNISTPTILQAPIASNKALNFDAVISLETPLADYKRLIAENVESENMTDDDVINNNYQKIASVARNTVWKLLFESDSITKEDQTKIAEFLKKIKDDACFHDASTYNEWIIGVRDELLKRNMIDFWREHMVEKELGPCWARDSDYFDDMEDPTPREFYNYAGCVAPFAKVNGK